MNGFELLITMFFVLKYESVRKMLHRSSCWGKFNRNPIWEYGNLKIWKWDPNWKNSNLVIS